MDKRSTLCEVIKDNSNINSKGITFILGDDNERFISYSELFEKATLRLYDLQLKGVRQGDELVFQIDNSQDYICYFWACLLGKIIPVPLTVSNHDEHIMMVFNVWKTLINPHLIIDTISLENLEKASVERNMKIDEIRKHTLLLEEMTNKNQSGIIYGAKPEDIAFIPFSSGSTGNPKGVTLTHANLMSNTKAIGKHLTEADISLSWMPMTHVMGLVVHHLASTVKGINQCIMDKNSFVGNPIRWIRKAHEHKASVLYSPNFGYKYFLSFYDKNTAMDWDLTNIRMIINAAEPISVEICNKFLDKMAKYGLKRSAMIPLYGLTETSSTVCYHPLGERYVSVCVDRRNLKLGENIREINNDDVNGVDFVEVGPAVDDCEIRIYDGSHGVLGDSQIGYIQVRGKNIMTGYYNNPEATSMAMTDDGWFNTGDLGFIRNGKLVITGRSKDIIIVDGKNIYPHDIERLVEGVEGVKNEGVISIGVLDKDLGTEKIIVFILFEGTVEAFVPLVAKTKKQISVRSGLVVKEVLPIKEIPKTVSGKLQRYKLSAMYRTGAFEIIAKQLEHCINQYYEENENETAVSILEGELLVILLRVLSSEKRKIGVNDNFMEFGVSSILLGQIIEKIDDLYPGKIKVQDVFAHPTISKLAKFIESKGDFEIPGLKLPHHFFHKTNGRKTSRIEFQFKDNLNYSIKKISEEQKIDVKNILFVAYVYLLSKVSEEEEFYIQAILDKPNTVTPVKIKLGPINEWSNVSVLVNEITQIRKNTKSYSIEKIQNIKLRRDDSVIIPLFYDKTLLDRNIDLSHVFKMIMEMDLKDDVIFFSVIFNTLKDQSVKEFIYNYVKIIKTLVDFYISEKTEVG